MTKAIFLAALIPALAVLAQIEPSEPAPGNVYNAGSDCVVEWVVDPTGQWTEMNIQLMTGSNSEMVHLTTVATVDGTKDTRFSYTCPSVDPNSAIYFYQFSTPAAPGNLTWTGRFAIADASGNTLPPAEEADGIQFGTGVLADPSSASPTPSYLSGADISNIVGPSGNATSNSAAIPTAQTVIATSATGALAETGHLASVRGTATRSVDSEQASESASGSASSQESASGASALVIDFKTRSLQALVGLVSTALVFTAML